jgi:pimeloyl-ACP methyl ester carboxylesterase
MTASSWSFPGHEQDAPAEIWTPDTDGGAVPGVVISGDLMAKGGEGIASVLGPKLAARGFVAISATPAAHRDTKAFKSATLSGRVEEAERLVTALFERMAAPGKVDIRKIALLGHGIGGAVAAAEARKDSRLGAVIAVGAPRTPEAYFPKDALEAWSRGKTARIKSRDGALHELDGALYEDWKARPELDHSTAARQTGADVVWIHGTADETVPVDESRRAYWKHPEAGRRARLVEIQGADHDFSSETHANKLVEAIAEQLAQSFAQTLAR